MKMLYDIDLDHVTMMVNELTDYYFCLMMLALEGPTMTMTNKGGYSYTAPSPWFKIKQTAFQNFLSIAARFGLTPSARSKISLPSNPEELDPLMALVAQKKSMSA